MKLSCATGPPACSLEWRWRSWASFSVPDCNLFLIEQIRPANPLALENHALHALNLLDLFQRISVHQQQIRVVAFLDQPHPAIHTQQSRGIVSGALQRNSGGD